MSDSIFHWKQQAKGTEAEDLITKKMFPKREEYQWRPAPVLCKRFDLIDPYMGKVVYSVFLPTVLFPVLPYSKLFFLLTNPCPFLFFFFWNTCFSKNLPFLSVYWKDLFFSVSAWLQLFLFCRIYLFIISKNNFIKKGLLHA